MKKYCFDIDGVICKTIKKKYKSSKPNNKVIKLINNLYDQGHYIIIFTSRFIGRNKENVKLAKKQGYNFTNAQLKNWGLKFHKLILGKPSFDVLVDDKDFNHDINWHKKIFNK